MRPSRRMRCGQPARRLLGLEQLERDLAVQLRVERPIHLAEGALANLLHELQAAPLLRRLTRRDDARIRTTGRLRKRDGRNRLDPSDDLGRNRLRRGFSSRAVDIGDARQNAQLTNEHAIVIVGQLALEGVPVEGTGSVGDGIDDLAERIALRLLHGGLRPLETRSSLGWTVVVAAFRRPTGPAEARHYVNHD